MSEMLEQLDAWAWERFGLFVLAAVPLVAARWSIGAKAGDRWVNGWCGLLLVRARRGRSTWSASPS